jgi:hypothetical protein
LNSRIAYRSRQFFKALLGRVTAEEMEEARGVLGPELYKIFERMPGQYRYHMLDVYRRVREAGCDDPLVWQAALLHDSGKFDPSSGKYVSLPYRVAIVLLKATALGRPLLERLAESDFGFWILDFGLKLPKSKIQNPKSKHPQAGTRNPKSVSGLAKQMGWRYPFYLSKRHAWLGAQRAAEHGAPHDLVELIARHHVHTEQSDALSALQAADERS